MYYKGIFVVLGLIIVTFYAVQEYKKSGSYIDSTFSNISTENQQYPKVIEGSCSSGVNILSAKVINETPSSILLRVIYCNDLVSDKAVLGIKANAYPIGWAYTPGGTVVGHGDGYVRLEATYFEKPITVSSYKIWLYGNNSSSELATYNFNYEKVWCTNIECT